MSDSHAVLCVCDGISSSHYSAEAARLAVQVVLEHCAQTNDWSDPPALAEIWAEYAHQTVSRDYKHQGMCTLVLAVVAGSEVFGVYAGGSMCQLTAISGESLSLTEPHRKNVLRMQNGKPLFLDGMPVFDKGLTQALGQPGPLHTDSFTAALLPGTWLACFTDGVDERLLAAFLQRGVVNAQTVEAFVTESALRTDDDATLLLFQPAPDAERMQLCDALADYTGLDAKTKTTLLGQLNHTLLVGQHQDALAAFHAESDDCLAVRLAELLLASGELDREVAVQMLDAAVLRRQVATTETLRRALTMWHQ